MNAETPTANFFETDANLARILARIAPDAARRWRAHLSEFGAWVAAEVDPAADYTDRFGRPVLEAYDRDGALVNRIRHNPGWEAVSREVYRRGIVGLNYGDDPAPFAVTFAMGYLLSQADISLHCPVTMTGAVAYVLDRFAPDAVKAAYLPQLTRMDGRALTGGTWATELHGGSDVGATTTVARADGDHVRLDGLKWFTSNPAGGLALATARPAGAVDGYKGLGLYLVPTRLPDGTANPMRLRRLKDKLGTCGVPTGEVDLTGTWAVAVAPPPAGMRIMMEALEFSRIHNAMAAVGVQRRAFTEALGYASERAAFGHVITEYPMIRDQLLGLLVRLEAGAALAFEAVHAFDASEADGDLRPWLRLVTALAKSRTADDAQTACRTAMEVIGGNAYTADFVLPRLMRDAEALPIWEGPANIQALELLRLLGNELPGHIAFERRVAGIAAGVPSALGDLAAAVSAAAQDCFDAIALIQGDPALAERHARRLMDLMADTLSAALLLEEATEGHAEGNARKAHLARLFVEMRLAPPPHRGITADENPAHTHFAALVGDLPVKI